VNGPVPVAVTPNVAVWPAVTVTLAGWLIVRLDSAGIFDPWNPPEQALMVSKLTSAANAHNPTLDRRRGTRRIVKSS